MSLTATESKTNQVQDDILNQEIASGKLAHAYLFFGSDQDVMAASAVKFSKALNCFTSDVLGNCQGCISCTKIDGLNHPDIVHIHGKGITEQIKIDQIRALGKDAYLKPIEAKKKVYIIYNADKMTHQAANSLLKTLEEPPQNVVIILISSRLGSFLPTIISRCQIVKFSQLQQEVQLTDEEALGIDEFLNAEDAFSTDRLEFIKKTKTEQLRIIDLLMSYFRDVLVFKYMNDASYIVNTQRKEEIKNASGEYNTNKIAPFLDELLKIKDLLASNVNSKMIADSMLNNLFYIKTKNG